MKQKLIYHIVTIKEWELQKNNVFYKHPTLESEGFIHTSTIDQIDATIKRYYANEKKVIILTIDVSKVHAEIKYELAPKVNQLFPHIFGELNLDAVVSTEIHNV
jgi:uncharacterized protein (DUF952 family)